VQNRGNVVCPLSELQAAALLPQLDRLDERNARRKAAVARLDELLSDVPGLSRFRNAIDGEPGYYKVGFCWDEARFGVSRTQFVTAMRAEGIAFDEGFRALHVGRSPKRCRLVGTLPEAERAHSGCVVLHHPVLLGSPEDIAQVAWAARKVQHRDRS
jgi:dTDP-4-amino-4,6-dideoxygalactose transaminase